MTRKSRLPPPQSEIILECLNHHCQQCGKKMWSDYESERKLRTLEGIIKLRLKVRRCQNTSCSKYRKVFRPEGEGSWALPVHEFGLDVIAHIGALRYQEHRSVTQIHQCLRDKGVIISARTVSNLLDRYDEILAVSLTDSERLKHVICAQEYVILAIDGMQPDVGHEVLWVIRDCISQEILLAKTILSSRAEELKQILTEVAQKLPVPIKGIISDGEQSIQKAVREAFPEVPHGLCHFHYLREAAKPIYEADRHAKKELKKQIRGIRTIEREIQTSEQPMNKIVEGYCLAVRSAITDDGRPPLEASGLKLHERLSKIEQSITKMSKKGNSTNIYSD